MAWVCGALPAFATVRVIEVSTRQRARAERARRAPRPAAQARRPTARAPKGKAQAVPAEYLRAAPGWVTDPEAAFPADRGKVLYGVGFADKAPNPALTRRTSAAAARVDLASRLKAATEATLKGWMKASPDVVRDSAAAGKPFIEAVTRGTTSVVFPKARPTKFWTAPNGTAYCLVALNLDDSFHAAFVGKTREALNNLPPQQRQALLSVDVEAAVAVFEDYLAKQRGAER